MLETGAHDLFSTATEFKAVSGWTIRLAKGQEVHFESEATFGTWLKQTTVTPGDMICKDGQNWESLGSYLLGQRTSDQRDSQSYTVPPTTLDAPDPEDEFEEFDSAIEALDGGAETPRPQQKTPVTSAVAPIMSTAVGHEKRVPPPIPGRTTTAYEAADVHQLGSGDDDETITIATVTEAELSAVQPAPKADAAKAQTSVSPRTVSPAGEHQSAVLTQGRVAPAAPSTAGGGGFGKLVTGLVIGAVCTSLAGLVLKPTDQATSSAQRVVVTQEGSELNLKDKEVLETSERWRSYLVLNSTSAPQLRSRLEASKEKTMPGRAQRDAFILAAYATDLHRTKGTADRDDVLSLYVAFMTAARVGALANAFTSLQSLDVLSSKKSAQPPASATPLAQPPVVKSTVVLTPATDKAANAQPKTQPPAASEGIDGAVKPSKPAKANAVTPKKLEPAKPKSPSKTDKATYSKMLRAGTRHLENGRLKDASIALRKAADIKPKAHAPQFKLGYVALNRGNLSQALRYFKRARDIKPRDRETLLGLGSVFEKMGRKADARRIYERYQTYFKGANDRRRIEYKLEKLGR
jgi:tetratricopeptide (TPR) repeat protein